MTAPRQIGIAIVTCEGHVLVGTRSADQTLAGCAEFPGGKCQPGESPASAAVRECLEETGLRVVAVREDRVVGWDYDHGRVKLHFWRCRPDPDAQPLTEPRRPFRWIPMADLSGLDFPPANHGMLRQLIAESAPDQS